MSIATPEQVAPSDLYITLELHRRVPKNTDHLMEKVALQDIAAQMLGKRPVGTVDRGRLYIPCLQVSPSDLYLTA